MISRELVAASTRPLILAVLSRGESYGYAIIQQIREESNGTLEWSEGMLYPVLHRMEKEKLIAAIWKTGSNGRRRKYYRLTSAGSRAVTAEQRQWLDVHNTLLRFWGPNPCLS